MSPLSASQSPRTKGHSSQQMFNLQASLFTLILIRGEDAALPAGLVETAQRSTSAGHRVRLMPGPKNSKMQKQLTYPMAQASIPERSLQQSKSPGVVAYRGLPHTGSW